MSLFYINYYFFVSFCFVCIINIYTNMDNEKKNFLQMMRFKNNFFKMQQMFRKVNEEKNELQKQLNDINYQLKKCKKLMIENNLFIKENVEYCDEESDEESDEELDEETVKASDEDEERKEDEDEDEDENEDEKRKEDEDEERKEDENHKEDEEYNYDKNK